MPEKTNKLTDVKTIALRQAVKRNSERFPVDFMFQLTAKEAEVLVSETVIASRRSLGGSLPYAFTEQGVAMISSALNGARSVQVNIAILRAFIKLREMMGKHKDLARKVAALERKYQEHDEELPVVFDAIKKSIEPAPRQRSLVSASRRSSKFEAAKPPTWAAEPMPNMSPTHPVPGWT